MLGLGDMPSRDCRRLTRRSFLQAAGSLGAAFGLAGLDQRLQAAEDRPAKSVLLVWLWGGPSHLDLFDPKPDAPLGYRGPFQAIGTRTSGLQFTELLPKTAQLSHLFSVVHSNVNHSGDHLVAGSIGLTGGNEGPAGHPPNFGSIVARHRPAKQLPTFVSVADGPIGDGRGPMKGYGGGEWGTAYDPFMVSCSADSEVSVPAFKLLDGLTPERLLERRRLHEDLGRLEHQLDDRRAADWDLTYESAFSLLNSKEAQRAFDLSREPEATRRAYGRTAFGQSALLGRRLVEAGVPYVQVNWSRYVEVLFPFSDYGWDTHTENFELLAEWHGPIFDRVFSTLLNDLQQRGLLETTLVVCLGEFGRTPKINGIGSRDHWHQCYSSLWAGAGVQPGRVVGESDRFGQFPLTDPVPPASVGTTMLDQLGVGTADRAALRVLPEGRVIEGLF